MTDANYLKLEPIYEHNEHSDYSELNKINEITEITENNKVSDKSERIEYLKDSQQNKHNVLTSSPIRIESLCTLRKKELIDSIYIYEEDNEEPIDKQDEPYISESIYVDELDIDGVKKIESPNGDILREYNNSWDEQLLKNADIIGNIQENEKITEVNGVFMIDTRYFQFINRWLSNDSRYNTLKIINELINNIKNRINSLLESKNRLLNSDILLKYTKLQKLDDIEKDIINKIKINKKIKQLDIMESTKDILNIRQYKKEINIIDNLLNKYSISLQKMINGILNLIKTYNIESFNSQLLNSINNIQFLKIRLSSI